MRKIFLTLIIVFVATVAIAQPRARREQQVVEARQSNRNNMTVRAQISFPTEPKMSESVVWRRDVYRELDLKAVSYTHVTLPTKLEWCRSRWSPYH